MIARCPLPQILKKFKIKLENDPYPSKTRIQNQALKTSKCVSPGILEGLYKNKYKKNLNSNLRFVKTNFTSDMISLLKNKNLV